jgi:hypothetical protein
MENTLKIAAQTYSTLNPSYISGKEVLEAIKGGNEAVKNSVIMLMLGVA